MGEFTSELIRTMTPVILSSIVFVGWCARLEAKVLYLDKDRGERLETSRVKESALLSKIDGLQCTINDLVKTVARLEGRLDNRGHQNDC